MEEESKIRQTKAIANDQLRILQTDLSKIEVDFKNKQRTIDDLDKYRRAMEEESEVRRRDLETQLSSIIRDIEEENRKLSNTRYYYYHYLYVRHYHHYIFNYSYYLHFYDGNNYY